MYIDSAKQPTILVDLKKNRITITRKTLQIIGDPKHILLLVSTEERTLVVLQGDGADKRAHRIPPLKTERVREVALYSKSLLTELRNISDGWQDNLSYRVRGVFIPGENVLRFHVADAKPTR